MLHERRIRFLVIGGVAARFHGSPSATLDLDICYERSRENLDLLAEALRGVHARLRRVDPDPPFQLDRRTFELGDHFTLVTDLGSLDCLATPAGTDGYDDLIRRAVEVKIEGIPLKFADIDDLMRMKRAAGRPKDRIELEILGALRNEIEHAE